MMKSTTLKRKLTIDAVIGGLMMTPLVACVLPGNHFEQNIKDDVGGLSLLIVLILWTVFLTWFMRLRELKDIEVCMAVLILIGGMVTTTFILSVSIGLGIFSVGLACALPYAYSGLHMKRISMLMVGKNSEE